MIRVDGRAHSRLMNSLAEALSSESSAAMKQALSEIEACLSEKPEPIDLAPEDLAAAAVPALAQRNISDHDLAYLNAVLPWSSFLVDERGRHFGNRYTKQKRSKPDALRDARIRRLAALVETPEKMSVTEYGCFEGNHTAQLCDTFAQVVAIDGRIENCLKTLVRCWLLGKQPDVRCINLEADDADLPRSDICHHVGVLYHLTRPVAHLVKVLERTRVAVLLDSQIARSDGCNIEIEVLGRKVPAYRYREADIAFAPFAGMDDHAIWLTFETICEIAESCGFKVADASQRDERNGARGTFYLVAG